MAKKFIIMSKEYVLSDEMERYARERKKFSKLVDKVYDKFPEQYYKTVKGVGNFKESVLEIGMPYIKKAISYAMKYLVNNNVLELAEEDFVNDYVPENLCYVQYLERVLNEINNIKDKGSIAESYAVANGGPDHYWSGGGFGISGAVAGSLMAGGLNAVANARSSRKLRAELEKIENATNNQMHEIVMSTDIVWEFMNQISSDIFLILDGLRNAAYKYAKEKRIGYITEAGAKLARGYAENVAKMKNEEEIKKYLFEGLCQDPLSGELYKVVYEKDMDENGGVAKLANFFGYDISEYTTALITKKFGKVQCDTEEQMLKLRDDLTAEMKKYCLESTPELTKVEERWKNYDLEMRTLDNVVYATREDKSKAEMQKAKLLEDTADLDSKELSELNQLKRVIEANDMFQLVKDPFIQQLTKLIDKKAENKIMGMVDGFQNKSIQELEILYEELKNLDASVTLKRPFFDKVQKQIFDKRKEENFATINEHYSECEKDQIESIWEILSEIRNLSLKDEDQEELLIKIRKDILEICKTKTEWNQLQEIKKQALKNKGLAMLEDDITSLQNCIVYKGLFERIKDYSPEILQSIMVFFSDTKYLNSNLDNVTMKIQKKILMTKKQEIEEILVRLKGIEMEKGELLTAIDMENLRKKDAKISDKNKLFETDEIPLFICDSGKQVICCSNRNIYFNNGISKKTVPLGCLERINSVNTTREGLFFTYPETKILLYEKGSSAPIICLIEDLVYNPPGCEIVNSIAKFKEIFGNNKLQLMPLENKNQEGINYGGYIYPEEDVKKYLTNDSKAIEYLEEFDSELISHDECRTKIDELQLSPQYEVLVDVILNESKHRLEEEQYEMLQSKFENMQTGLVKEEKIKDLLNEFPQECSGELKKLFTKVSMFANDLNRHNHELEAREKLSACTSDGEREQLFAQLKESEEYKSGLIKKTIDQMETEMLTNKMRELVGDLENKEVSELNQLLIQLNKLQLPEKKEAERQKYISDINNKILVVKAETEISIVNEFAEKFNPFIKGKPDWVRFMVSTQEESYFDEKRCKRKGDELIFVTYWKKDILHADFVLTSKRIYVPSRSNGYSYRDIKKVAMENSFWGISMVLEFTDGNKYKLKFGIDTQEKDASIIVEYFNELISKLAKCQQLISNDESNITIETSNDEIDAKEEISKKTDIKESANVSFYTKYPALNPFKYYVRENAGFAKKVSKALKQNYANGVDASQIIFICDNTLFGSMKDGVVITNEACYGKSTFGVISIDLKQIRKLKVTNNGRIVSAVLDDDSIVVIIEIYQNNEGEQLCMALAELLKKNCHIDVEVDM